MKADVSSAAPSRSRSPTAASTSSPAGWRAHHFEDVRRPRWGRWRASVAGSCSSRTTSSSSEAGEEADRLRDPTHVRNYSEDEWRELLRPAPGSRSRSSSARRSGSDSRPGSSAPAAPATRPPGSESFSPTGSRTASSGSTAASSRRGSGLMAIVVDNDTRLVVQGATGAEGSFHTLRNRDYGTQVVAGRHARQGRHRPRGHPDLRHRRATPSPRPGANTTMVFVPARFATDAIYEAVDAGIGTVICIAEGLPAHEMLRVYNYIRPKGITMLGPELPGRALAGQGERRDHPGRDLPRGPDRRRLALGHAHVPDRPRADAARARQLDDRRHRRRPGRRLVLHRHPRSVSRRTRRPRSIVMVGEIGGDEEEKAAAFIEAEVYEAGRRLHRRLHRAAGEDHGPRGRDHLRLLRHRPGEEGRARGAGRHESARRRPRSPSWPPRSPALPRKHRLTIFFGRGRVGRPRGEEGGTSVKYVLAGACAAATAQTRSTPLSRDVQRRLDTTHHVGPGRLRLQPGCRTGRRVVGRLPDQGVRHQRGSRRSELRQSRSDDVVRVRLLQRVQRPLA